jgi:hypothetical protein
MIIQRKTQIFLALFVSSIFLLQNCATIFRGTRQKIPITSNPQGAKIIVDGEEMGYAPLNLKLKRKKNHIMRIEKEGFNPLEIRISRGTSIGLTTLGNILWGFIGATLAGGKRALDLVIIGGFLSKEKAEEESRKVGTAYLLGFLIGCGGTMLVDHLSGANFRLSPKNLNVTLTKMEGKSQPDLILLDAEQFQNIKWIRIKCANSNREDEIVNFE